MFGALYTALHMAIGIAAVVICGQFIPEDAYVARVLAVCLPFLILARGADSLGWPR